VICEFWGLIENKLFHRSQYTQDTYGGGGDDSFSGGYGMSNMGKNNPYGKSAFFDLSNR